MSSRSQNQSDNKSESEYQSESPSQSQSKTPKPLDTKHTIYSWPEDPSTMQMLAIGRLNAQQKERNDKLEAKRQKQEQQSMEQFEKIERQRTEWRRDYRKRAPEIQFKMFASGKRFTCAHCQTTLRYQVLCHNTLCLVKTPLDIEPLMTRLKQEISSMKTAIKIDEQTNKRLVEFAKEGETYSECFNRLLDSAASAAAKAAPAPAPQAKRGANK